MQCKHPNCQNEWTVESGWCKKHYTHTLNRRYHILVHTAGDHLGISKHEYMELCKDELCFYCKAPILTTGHSLDRLDSSIGYVLDNVVQCCRNCNTVKNSLLTSEEMVAIIAALRVSRNKPEGEPLWTSPQLNRRKKKNGTKRSNR